MIIFVTAFDRYAVKAFDVGAVDYVLKPLDANRVALKVERARSRKFKNNSDISAPDDISLERIDELSEHCEILEKLSNRVRTRSMKDKLGVKDAGVLNVLAFADIDWIDAAGDYMCVNAVGRTHIPRSTMK